MGIGMSTFPIEAGVPPTARDRNRGSARRKGRNRHARLNRCGFDMDVRSIERAVQTEEQHNREQCGHLLSPHNMGQKLG